MLVPSTTPLITQAELENRVEELAREVVADMGTDEPITVLGLLRGCFVFAADLVRAISRKGGDVGEIDFLIASSYGSGTSSSGNVKIELDARRDVAGKHVLVIDDILDTGHTLARVRGLLKSRQPSMLRVAVMLDKPSRREVEGGADYVGFAIEDHFVVGYGLDYDQHYRELPYITTMIEK